MAHAYEEIRAAIIDILVGREKTSYSPDQYQNLLLGVSEVMERRSATQARSTQTGSYSFSGSVSVTLDPDDRELVREVFWDLFRQGIITLGLNDSNRAFPFFCLSSTGKRIIDNKNSYFFHDVSTYEKLIKKEIPGIDSVTVIYLKEAMQAFRVGCVLSSTVMLGVATEHMFNLLIEIIENNPTHAPTYTAVNKERGILRRFNKFKSILDNQTKTLGQPICEDLDTHFAGILSIIRNFRNQSGHPSGHIIDREQCYVLLQLFIPYGRKIHQLMDHFR